MRKFVFIILIFFLSLSLAYSIEIKGKVLTQEGKPVEEAIILHRLSQRETLTDDQGFFSLDVPEAKRIRLEIIHPDYMEQEIVLTIKDISKKITVKLIPYIRQKEEIVVTALRYPEESTSVPAAETVILKETLEEKMAPNITEGLQNLPGVSNIGSGGFSVVPNIRGLARRRVLIMVDNARITSDRRTGPNASFVNPADIDKIEVLRSPSSVFYGSDAIGGVIHIFTKKSLMQKRIGGKININYGTVNQGKSLGFSLQGSKGEIGYYLSLRGEDSENYSSPLGKVLQSYFTSISLLGKISHQTEKREIHLSFLGARGFNIGKPNQDSSTKPTWYPKENQNLIQFHWLEKKVGKEGDLSFHLFFNPNFLETKKEKIETYRSEESFTRVQSLDFGFQFTYGKKISQNFRLKAGADFFGRFGVKTENQDTYFGPEGEVEEIIEQLPFTEGTRQDWGLFLSFDYTGIKNLDLVSGLRFDFLNMKAIPGNNPPSQKNRHSAWTGFFGASARLSEEIVAFVNISKAYRAPSLSERFYSGITGRGFIIGKPDLKPETSLNLDSGIKVIHKRYFIGLYFFHYRIDDMVERYIIEEKMYTYGNVETGKIQGLELEVEYYPIPGWRLFGNLYSFKGRSQETQNPLNDIPPFRVFMGTRIWKGHFWGEINATFQQKKRDPGPAEIEISGYGIVNIQAGYLLGSSFQIYLSISNLFNKTYITRPDPDSMEAPGRNFVLGLSCAF